MDEKGRLFGKINIVDYAVISFTIFILVPIIIFGIGTISTGKINPAVREREERSIAKEKALNERENSLKEREKAFKNQQYEVELSNRERELNFKEKELNLFKIELETQKKQLTEGLEKEKLQNWIEGVKEGVRLKLR